jgi:hypothetical protein
MKEIDIKQWHQFKILDIFETETVGKKLQVPTGSYIAKKDLRDGNIPRITVSGVNNGIAGYYSDTIDVQDYRIFNNFISVSFLGTVFYQEGQASLDMKVHCLKPKNINLNKHIAWFLVSIIRKVITYSTYNDQLSSTVLPNLIISLPSKMHTNGKYEPDWQYMEDYIKSIEKKVQSSSIQFSLSSKIEKESIDSHKWKEFKIDDLFHNKFVKPEVWHTRELVEDETGIPYVVRTKFNNGIKYNVLKTEKMTPSPAGTISFGAENATFFYQEKEYVSGRDIYYIDTTNLPKNTCLFLVACLQKITDKYSYNYGMFPDLVKEEVIKLPTDNNGNPDWNYMDNYIIQTKERAKTRLSNLENLQ